jgi:acetylornithine deacetylase
VTKTPFDPKTLDAVELLANLIAIPSVNPDLVKGGNGEAGIADFISAWFDAHGFEVHRLERHPGRPSIVGIARGTGGGELLMFNGHIDTVTLAGYDGDPLEPRIADGKIFGRGSFDMKGGVAAMMVAAARAKAKGISGDILVACVADEEYASFGTEEVAERFKADAAIVTEPSHLEVTIAHRGFVWFDVEVQGRAAHGSRPELGIDGIAKAGKFLVALEELDKRLRANLTHPILKSGSVHASIISGGEELSSYPAKCLIRLERRTIPGETVESTEAELQAIIDKIKAADADFKATITAGLARPPFDVGMDEAIVKALQASAELRLGKAPDWRGEPFWTDCAILQSAGIPCVMFGVDGGGAHAATEWATTSSVEALADILTETAVRFCN